MRNTHLGALLDNEFTDMGMNWEIESIERDYGSYDCYVKVFFSNQESRVICFRVIEGNVLIELGEDHFEECEWWENSVKYLWMAVLDWPQYRRVEG